MRSFRLSEEQELPPVVYVLFLLGGVASGLWLLGVHPVLLACIGVGMLASKFVLDVPGEGLRQMGTVRGSVLWAVSTFLFSVFALVAWAVFTAL